MEHLVESHHGGYYVSSLDKKIITEHCEQCGDSDRIILSWEEGHKMDALIQYFSAAKYSKEDIEENIQAGITKQEFIESVSNEYSFYNKNMIKTLYEERIILKSEYKRLLRKNLQAQKSQFLLVNETCPKESRKVLKKQ